MAATPESRTPRPVARLALEDGTVFTGRAFGSCQASETIAGEVVFNTAMTGYQEAITDPSYAGQLLTMTAPQVGVCGVCPEDEESQSPQVAGFIVRELSRLRSNHRAEADLTAWLAAGGVLGLEGVDTRALVARLRTTGAMRGVLSCDAARADRDLVDIARASPTMTGRNLAAEVGAQAPFDWREDLGRWRAPGSFAGGVPLRVVALDCGAKRNIYRHLIDCGCTVEVIPHDASAEQIHRRRPDGLLVSNGPGDPAAVDRTIATLASVAGAVPTFGICLGHQLLALALGATTFKLKFGHRGANQPVRNLLTGRVEITSQNHGFCVDADSLTRIGCEITHLHLNDATAAGFRHLTRPIFSVQFHPEASPGPHDSSYLFRCFVEMMRSRAPVDAGMVRRSMVGSAEPTAESV